MLRLIQKRTGDVLYVKERGHPDNPLDTVFPEAGPKHAASALLPGRIWCSACKSFYDNQHGHPDHTWKVFRRWEHDHYMLNLRLYTGALAVALANVLHDQEHRHPDDAHEELAPLEVGAPLGAQQVIQLQMHGVVAGERDGRQLVPRRGRWVRPRVVPQDRLALRAAPPLSVTV